VILKLSVLLVAACPGSAASAQPDVAHAGPCLGSIEIGLDSLDGPGRSAPLAVAGAALLARRRSGDEPRTETR
jgi:hypothetical protein